MENKSRYNKFTFLRAWVLSPLILSAGIIILLIGSSFFGLGIVLAAAMMFLFVYTWVRHAKKAELPEKASETFFPILLAFGCYMLAWVVIFGLARYRYASDAFIVLFFLTLPYFGPNFMFALFGNFSFFPVLNAAVTGIIMLTVAVTRAAVKKKIRFDKRFLIYLTAAVCLCGVAGFQFYHRSTIFIDRDSHTERIGDEVNLYAYRPFDSRLLQTPDETPTLSFDKKYPRLDGATAAYPVYAAMAQALYTTLDKDTVGRYVRCSTTDAAYERLILREIDIFFGAQPSKQQMELAAENDVELVLTPIAREAFVFMVNRTNPVDSLTLGQIQDIYQKKITNWSKLGGNDEEILPFQRPENSGSQTVMLAAVMGGKKLPAPLWEEYSSMMGGTVSQVAEYRNSSSAIGYSFRYFATGMKPNDNIKLLTIDGIGPSVENIRNGAYPFTVDVYAVTVGPPEGNSEKLIEWILSEQGQSFIEKCGYVRRGRT